MTLAGCYDMGDSSCPTQLIDGDGVYNLSGMENFMKSVKLCECGVSYAIVSIMGPVISGKSTLLNRLFHTNFREMDALKGRYQTTQGIWLAKCVDIEPCTIIMDLEGFDGRERGKDDTVFEKQIALFALAVSDIVLINMWCHDIGRVHDANSPLLEIVFQVMMQLFSPRKTTLLFVIRNKTKIPLENLEAIVRENIQKIWDSVQKSLEHINTPLSEFFNVEVVALSNFEEKEEQFNEQVAKLRKSFFHSISPGGLAGDRRNIISASRFPFIAQQIWKVIKENDDLNLPSYKVLVASFCCEKIAYEKIASFSSNEEWRHLEEAVQNGIVPGFGKKLNSILENYLIGYDKEAAYFDYNVRTSERRELESELLQFVQPAYHSMLKHLRSKTLEDFKVRFEKALESGERFVVAANDCTRSLMFAFNEGCKDVDIEQKAWDSSKSKARETLQRDMDAHVILVREAKLFELTILYEEKLNKALSKPVETLLDAASDDTWPAIRKLLQRELKIALSSFAVALSSFDVDETTTKKLLAKLEEYAIIVVESMTRKKAEMVLMYMKSRFFTFLYHNYDSMLRSRTREEAITKIAYSESLKLLSVNAAIRLDEENDNIEETLQFALMDIHSSSNSNRRLIHSVDPLASNTWKNVPSTRTLITPVCCKSLWRQFLEETKLFYVKRWFT